MIRLARNAGAVLLAAGLCASAAGATPILAGYPAPGGTTYSGSGNPGQVGGQTRTYSGFDPSAFDQLWWGVEELQLAMDGSIDEPGETLSLQSRSGAVTVWDGVTSINAGTVYTRATATVLSGGSDWIDPASIGILSTDIYSVSEVPGIAAFVVQLVFEASFTDGSGYQAFLPFFDANTGAGEDGNTRSSFYGNFYYTPVPLPAGLPMLGAALLGIGLLRRKAR